MDAFKRAGRPPAVAHVGTAPGLMGHVMALQGIASVGVDRSTAQIELAQACVKSQQYPAGPPAYRHQPDGRRLPFDDASLDLLMLFDAMERHPNPVGLLAEARRVLKPGKLLGIVATQRGWREDGPVDREHRYRPHELIGQVNICGWKIQLATDPNKAGPTEDIVLIAAT